MNSKKAKQKTVKFGSLSTSTPARNYDPLTVFSAAPSLTSASQRNQNFYPLSQSARKRKGKAKAEVLDLTLEVEEIADDRLWVDIYEPITEAELAVHIRKVEDVRRWFVEACNGGKLKKYRRILVLTGPAGTAKTATVRVLSRELGFEILEWRNSISDTFAAAHDGEIMDYASNDSHETLMTKFGAFFNRASNCQSFFTTLDHHHIAGIPQSSQPSSSLHDGPRDTAGRRIILLEDLPNVLHSGTQTSFHAILRASVQSPSSEPPVPIVIIISDAQTVGEVNDERVAQGRYRNGDGDGVMDIRTVLPNDLLGDPYVTQIRFNPIAPTLLRKALQNLLNTHFAQNKSAQPSKDVLDIVVETANGDIRSAIMALQFACVASPPIGKTRKKRDAKMATLMLESITRREQNLVLFHLLGKVLFNKRKGDPSNSSMSARKMQKENMLDAMMRDPPKLPVWLKEHDRRASRVDVDLLYASTPIDSGLYSLYIHQNYTEFATEVEECDGVMDWLSWVDSSGGEAWYQANPHQFHLLTLGTLHSLPSPVLRKNQKILKPQFFEYLEKEKEAWGAVHDVHNWLMHRTSSQDESAWRTCGWTVSEIVLELGGVLKATNPDHLPKSHQNFSRMMFQVESMASQCQQLDEDEVNFLEKENDDDAKFVENKGDNANMVNGGWLEDDDIEEF